MLFSNFSSQETINREHPHLIRKRKRTLSHHRNSSLSKQLLTINYESDLSKPPKISRINIFDQIQSSTMNIKERTIEPRQYLLHRLWETYQPKRVKTQKVENHKSTKLDSKSQRKTVYLRRKTNKSFNIPPKTQKINELSITQKELGSRPATALSPSFWGLPIKLQKKKRVNTFQVKKQYKIIRRPSLSPW